MYNKSFIFPAHRLTFSYSRTRGANPMLKPDIRLAEAKSSGKICPLCRNSVSVLPPRFYSVADDVYANPWVNFTLFPSNETAYRHFVNKTSGVKVNMTLPTGSCNSDFRPWKLASGEIFGY
jgi:hypothetical protein